MMGKNRDTTVSLFYVVIRTLNKTLLPSLQSTVQYSTEKCYNILYCITLFLLMNSYLVHSEIMDLFKVFKSSWPPANQCLSTNIIT